MVSFSRFKFGNEGYSTNTPLKTFSVINSHFKVFKFSTEKYLFFKVFKANWFDFKVFKVRQPSGYMNSNEPKQA